MPAWLSSLYSLLSSTTPSRRNIVPLSHTSLASSTSTQRNSYALLPMKPNDSPYGKDDDVESSLHGATPGFEPLERRLKARHITMSE